MCTGLEVAAVTSAVTGVAGLSQSRASEKNARNEAKALDKKQTALNTKAQTEKFAAKKREYTTQRDTLRRGQQRGRMSTILNKSDTLG